MAAFLPGRSPRPRDRSRRNPDRRGPPAFSGSPLRMAVRGCNDPFVVSRFPEVGKLSGRLSHVPASKSRDGSLRMTARSTSEHDGEGDSRYQNCPLAPLALAGAVVVVVQDHSSFMPGTRIAYQKKGRSISRVLSRVTISLGAAVSRALVQPTRRFRAGPRGFRRGAGRASSPLLLGFAPNEVFRAPPVAGRAVGSCPAFSPLPRAATRRSRAPEGGMFSVALSVPGRARFARRAETRALPGVLLSGARTFLSRGPVKARTGAVT